MTPLMDDHEILEQATSRFPVYPSDPSVRELREGWHELDQMLSLPAIDEVRLREGIEARLAGRRRRRVMVRAAWAASVALLATTLSAIELNRRSEPVQPIGPVAPLAGIEPATLPAGEWNDDLDTDVPLVHAIADARWESDALPVREFDSLWERIADIESRFHESAL